MSGVFLFWLACAILSAVTASNKGRSGFGWFIIGFLFGPFGFILSLVVSDKSVEKHAVPAPSQSYKPTTIGNKPQAASEMAICPFCAEEVRSAARKCKHCGEALEPKRGDTIKIYKGLAIDKEVNGCSVDGRKFVSLFEAERWIDGQR